MSPGARVKLLFKSIWSLLGLLVAWAAVTIAIYAVFYFSTKYWSAHEP